MSDSLQDIAALLFKKEKALQPPRFAKVESVDGDSMTVQLGSDSADAVRCTACEVGDVVLLETMPSGTLAAVATRGATGGSTGGAVWGGITGTLSNQTDLSEALSGLQGQIDALSCTENSGGATFAECEAYAANGWGWREEKHGDGRLTLYIWDWFSVTATTSYKTLNYPADATPFVDAPIPDVQPSNASGYVYNDAIATSIINKTSSAITIGVRRTNGATRVILSAVYHGHWK